MQCRDCISVLAAVLILRPQLTQPGFASFGNRGLGYQAAKDDLASQVEPMGWKRIDYVLPDAFFKGVQAGGRLWTALPGNQGNDLKRGGRLTATSHEIGSDLNWTAGMSLARNPH